jgi:uncharacterized protein (DUF4415 family)
MKKKPISKQSADSKRRLANMTDEEIDTSEISEVSPTRFAEAVVRNGLKQPEPKAQLTLRLDRDVLEWFRSQGRGYQTRINALLRAYMDANRRGAADKDMYGADLSTDSQAPNDP